jgi:hypothetical protein
MFKVILNIRLISVITFTAVLMLSFKISYIMDDFENFQSTLTINNVIAQTAGNEKKNKLSKLEASKTPIKASMLLDERNVDPTLFTENDIGVLQKLAQRRELIEERSEELTLQEGLLGAAEKRIDKKILELKRLIVALKKTIKKKKK